MTRIIVRNHKHIQKTLDSSELQMKAEKTNNKTIEIDVWKTSTQESQS